MRAFLRFTFCARGRAAICFVLAGFLTVVAHASTLRGQALDPQGRALTQAHVRLFAAGEGGTLLRRALTDMKGEFRLEDLPPGQYRLEVFAPGFRRYEQQIALGDGERQIEFQLSVAGVHEGVVVTATREEGETFDTPLPSALVSGQSLSRQLPANLAQALEEIPGVTWVNAGAFRSRPVIRGLGSNRVLVLVDGERLNNSRTSTDDSGIETSLVDVGQIEQVEVVRGPGSVLHGGDAFGGVVNIRTKGAAASDQLRVGARIRGETFSDGDARRVRLELFGGNRWLGVRAAGSGGAAENYASPAGTVFRTGADENSALGEIHIYPQPHRSLYFKFLDRNALNFGFPDVIANPAFLGEFPYSRFRKYGAGYQASYTSGVFTAVQLRFYHQEQDRDFLTLLRASPSISIQSDTRTNVETYGFEFQASSLAARRHALTYGVTYYHDRSEDLRTQVLNPLTRPIVISRAPSVPNSTLGGTGLFLQDQFEVTKKVRLTAGVRYDRFTLAAQPTPNFSTQAFSGIAESSGDNALTGSLGASYEVLPGWALTAQAARAFREPNLFERYFFGRGPFGGLLIPNPNLRPETSVEVDLGTRVRRGGFRGSLNYFVNNLRDQLIRIPSTFQGQPVVGGEPVFQNTNVERSRIQGIESSAEFDLQRWQSQWSPFVTMAWQRGNNLSQNGPLPFIAPFVAQAGLRWQPRQTRAWAEWRTRIVKGTDRVPAGLLPLSGFTVHAWRWGYEMMRGEQGLGERLPQGLAGVNFHFGFENVTDKLYRGLFETVPQPGRSLRFGLEFNFDSAAR